MTVGSLLAKNNRNMNKILSIIAKQKIIFPYWHLSRQVFPLSTNAFPILFVESKNHKNGLYQGSLSVKRHMGVLSVLKNKIYNSISDATKVKVGGCLAYEKVADSIDYKEFIHCFELPDTFQSWFLSLQLHMWMVITTTISGKNGLKFRNSLVDSMWNDVELRIDQLAHIKGSDKKKYLKELVMQFQAGLISYDEGILSNDSVLAAAVWRMLYGCKNVDPELLENAVFYVRKQLSYLNGQNLEQIMHRGVISFLPLSSLLPVDKDMLI